MRDTRKTAKAKKNSRQSKQAKKGQGSKPSKKIELDTFGKWLDKQKEHELEKGTFRSFTEGTMPSDTTQEWLSKQSVSDSSLKVEVEMPASTTEAWLRKQVSDRISRDEKAAAVEAPQEAAPAPAS